MKNFWARQNARIYQSRKGEWRLITDERKRVLLNNIYGADIGHQAVEVTKLFLLLKILENKEKWIDSGFSINFLLIKSMYVGQNGIL